MPLPPPKPIKIKFSDGIFDMIKKQFIPEAHEKAVLTLGYSYDRVNKPLSDLTTLKQQVMQFLKLIIPNSQQRHYLLHALAKALAQGGTMARYIWSGDATIAKTILINIIELTFGKYYSAINPVYFSKDHKQLDKGTIKQYTNTIPTSRLIFVKETAPNVTLVLDRMKHLLGMLIIPTDGINFPKPINMMFNEVAFNVELEQDTTPNMDQQDNMSVGLFHLLRDYCCNDVTVN